MQYLREKISMEVIVDEENVRIDKYLASPPEKVAIKVYKEY